MPFRARYPVLIFSRSLDLWVHVSIAGAVGLAPSMIVSGALLMTVGGVDHVRPGGPPAGSLIWSSALSRLGVTCGVLLRRFSGELYSVHGRARLDARHQIHLLPKASTLPGERGRFRTFHGTNRSWRLQRIPNIEVPGEESPLCWL